MSVTRSPSRIRRLLSAAIPDVGAAFSRFPVALIFAALFTGYIVFEISELLALENETNGRILLALGLSFFWSVAVGIHCEAGRHSSLRRAVLIAAGVGVAVALAVFADAVALVHPLPVAVVLLVLGLSAHLRRGVDNEAFWLFNHQLWIGGIIAVAGGALFAAGVSAILATLTYLFGISFADDTHAKIWTIALGIIGPLNWFTLIPREFDQRIATGEGQEFTSRAVAILVTYILAPLLLVYTVILYAYGVKIGLEGVLPKGRIGWMVLSFGSVGMLTALMAYPERKGNAWVGWFWRNWFWLTAGPLALLFVGVYRRISDYGVTEERYVVVAAGLWMGLLLILYGWPGVRRDLRVIPGALALVLGIAAAGPWGAYGLSYRSQVHELAELFERNKLLEDGRVVPVAAGEKAALQQGDAERIGSVLRYLGRHEQLKRIAPWFEGVSDNPFADDSASRYERIRAIASRIGVGDPATIARERANYTGVRSSEPGQFEIDGRARLFGPLHMSRNINSTIDTTKSFADPAPLKVTLGAERFEVAGVGGRKAVFELRRLADVAREERREGAAEGKDKPRPAIRNGPPLLFEPDSGELGVRLVLLSLYGRRDDDGSFRASTLGAWILLETP